MDCACDARARRTTERDRFVSGGSWLCVFVSAAAERIVDKSIVVHARVRGLLSDVIFFLLIRVFVFGFCFWF